MPTNGPVLAFTDLAEVDPATFRSEAIAAAAVAVMGIPQAVAYATIAGLPPAMGLYASAIPAVVGALLRSSRTVVIGPTNAVSLIVASSIVPTMADPVAAVATLALMVGLLQVGAGLLRMGTLVDYISASVVTGYVTGAATLIFVGQLPNLTGTRGATGDIVTRLWAFLASLPQAVPLAVVLGVGTIAVVRLLRGHLPRGVPMFLALALATAVSWLFSLHLHGVRVVADLAPIPASLPPFRVPSLSGLLTLLPLAVAAAVLSLVESSSIARSLSAKSGQRLDVTTDFVGLGAANVAAACFGGYPVSGSLSRSALGFQLGGRSRLVGLGAGLAVVAVVLWLGPLLNHAPLPAVAGLILVVATDLVDPNRIRQVWAAGSTDRFAFLGTVLGAWLLPLDQAIYLGVFISIALFLQRARLLAVRELDFSEAGTLQEATVQGIPHRCTAIRVVDVEGPLFFGAVSELEHALYAHVDDADVRVLIVRLKRVQGVDFTTAGVLEQVHAVMEANGRHLLLVGMRQEVMRRLEDIGLLDAFDPDELYPTEPGWFRAMNHALTRGLALVDATGPHACGSDCPIPTYLAQVGYTPPVLPATALPKTDQGHPADATDA